MNFPTLSFIASIALFTLFAGLHCAMQINNKNIIIKYKTNVFLSFLTAVVAGKKIVLCSIQENSSFSI